MVIVCEFVFNVSPTAKVIHVFILGPRYIETYMNRDGTMPLSHTRQTGGAGN